MTNNIQRRAELIERIYDREYALLGAALSRGELDQQQWNAEIKLIQQWAEDAYAELEESEWRARE